MQAYESRFHEKLAKDIEAQIDERLVHLGNGACQSFDDYRHRTGVLAGLALALSLAEETRKAMTAQGAA